jgi:3-oxoacyl-[acyl-carrier protein] reductase
MITRELEGKTALVTGAGRGLGKAISFKLAEMGARVAVNDLGETREAEGVINDLKAMGGEAIFTPADVTNNAQVKAMVASIVQKWGKIDILVNNAGITGNTLIMRLTEEEWDSVIDTNLKSAFLCSKYVLRSMISLEQGRIVNIASVAGLVGSMGRVNYAASKGGLIAFTRSLANEVGSRNITVNAVAPGFITTRLTDELSQEAKEAVLSHTVLKRQGTPRDVAELVGFLVSSRAGYITGQIISIDGGIT